ncbi:MAG TPA: ATP-grasp domain-containing protein, partial [Firmicutes bacterium]|nr:ATP-grasp domain-containing protein [Bacillota bacterium]
MKLFEYQAKQLFRDHGIPTPRGRLVKSRTELEAVLPELTFPLVVKAQVLVGGRGKAGGVKFAGTPEELKTCAAALLGTPLKGEPVTALLLEEKVPVVEEYYLAVTLDRARRLPLIMFSRSGGMDIEEVARTNPGTIARVHVDPEMGLRAFHLEELTQ